MRKMAFTAGSRRRTIVISGCKAFIYVKSPRKHIAQNHCHDLHCTRCKRGLCIGLQLGGTRQHVQRRSGLRSAERRMPRHHNLGRRSAQKLPTKQEERTPSFLFNAGNSSRDKRHDRIVACRTWTGKDRFGVFLCPPRWEKLRDPLRILFAGEAIAVSELRLSVLETSHRPSTTSRRTTSSMNPCLMPAVSAA